MSDAVGGQIITPDKRRFRIDIPGMLLSGWWLILISIAASIVYTMDDLRASRVAYTAQMQVVAAQPNGQLPNPATAALAAFLPTAQTGSDFRLYLDSLKSRPVADELAKNPEIMHTVFANQWNAATGTWFEPETKASDRWIRETEAFLGFPIAPWRAPDAETLSQFIGFAVQILEDPRKPYIATVTFSYGDREFARSFLAALHRAADGLLRQKAAKRTADYIAFLTNTLSKVTVAEHRQALAQALSEQERVQMVAASNSAYAADLFDAPWTSSTPEKFPTPFQRYFRNIVLGSIFGSLLSIIFGYLRQEVRKLSLGRRINWKLAE